MTGKRRTMLAIVLAGAAATMAWAQGSGVQPGQWETKMTINTVDMPGAPPMVANMMRGRTTTINHCITPEQATKGPQEMMKNNKTCTFTRYSVTGGRLSSEMVCKQGGGTTTATSSGSYTSTSFNATGRIVTTGGPMPMTMTSTTVGHRLGDCKS